MSRPSFIITGNENKAELAGQIISFYAQNHKGREDLFLYNNNFADIENGKIKIATRDRVKWRLEKAIDFLRPLKGGGHKQISLTDELMRLIMAIPTPGVPNIKMVTAVPVYYRSKNKIHKLVKPGYNPEAEIYYHEIDSTITTAATESASLTTTEAVSFLHDAIKDFPFDSDADRANAFALFVLFFVRGIIPGRTPIMFIVAPTPGTGKSLLASVTSYPYTGGNIFFGSQPANSEELRKTISSIIIGGYNAAIIDNVSEFKDSIYSMFSTAPTFSTRILGRSEIIDFDNNLILVVTGNNPTVTTENARRSVPITLIATAEKPWERTGFKHPNLLEYMQENRAQTIAAIFKLIDNWIENGSKEWSGKPLGSFEAYSRIIGGILENAGISGFLENRNSFFDNSENETGPWCELCHDWYREHSINPVQVRQLFNLTEQIDGFDFGNGTDKSKRTSFGMQLKRNQNRVFDGFRFTSLRAQKGRATVWKLEKIDNESATLQPFQPFTPTQPEKNQKKYPNASTGGCKGSKVAPETAEQAEGMPLF